MHARDLVLLSAALVAMYVSSTHDSGTVRYERSWYYATGASGGGAAPTLADLDGDGVKEAVLVADGAGRLVAIGAHEMVARAQRHPREREVAAKDSSSGTPHLYHQQRRQRGKASASAERFQPASVLARAATGKEANGRRGAAALASGTAGGQQLVAMMTEDFRLSVFDGDLKLVWERALADVGDAAMPDGTAREAAVLIVDDDDGGMVIVCGSADSHPESASAGAYVREDEDPVEAEVRRERAEGEHAASLADGRPLEESVDDGERGGAGLRDKHHITYFSFGARTGLLLWRYDSADYDRSLMLKRETLLPRRRHGVDSGAWSAADDARGAEKPFEHLSCRDFRETVLMQLPHRWTTRADTRLSLIHAFRHKHKKRRHFGMLEKGQEGRDRSAVGAIVGDVVHMSGITGTSSPAPSSPMESLRPEPNAVVAHLEEGIEIISVADGSPICKLHLGAGSVHADVNNDGVVDHAIAYGSQRRQHLMHESVHDGGEYDCIGVVRSGIPAQETLFEGSLCRRKFNLRHGELGMIDVVAPIAVPHWETILDAATAVQAKRSGQAHAHQAPVRRRKYDSIFLNSRGEITSYSPSGKRRWTLLAGTYWTERSRDSFAPDGTGSGRGSFFPSMTAMPLYAQTRRSESIRQQNGLLASLFAAVGETRIAVIDINGDILWSDELPPGSVAMSPVFPMDFNGDGVTDVLLWTTDGVIAYVGAINASAIVYQTLTGLLALSMVGVYLSQNPPAMLFARSRLRTRRRRL